MTVRPLRNHVQAGNIKKARMKNKIDAKVEAITSISIFRI
jgi:hypothetical protein